MKYTFSGEAPANSKVKIVNEAGEIVARAVAAKDGKFTTQAQLEPGTHHFRAVANDGNVEQRSSPIEVVVESHAGLESTLQGAALDEFIELRDDIRTQRDQAFADYPELVRAVAYGCDVRPPLLEATLELVGKSANEFFHDVHTVVLMEQESRLATVGFDAAVDAIRNRYEATRYQ
jgi:hypothetical protein